MPVFSASQWPLWVIRVVLTLCQPLPVIPEQRTSPDRFGWSGWCHFRTWSPANELTGLGDGSLASRMFPK
jgi:hypothetical protein